jgi:hypothetical protein
LAEGYSTEVERDLLRGIGWPGDEPDGGYRLFDIAFPSLPTRGVYYGSVFESNCLFISRALFDELGGYDERYAFPGGGLVGVDFFRRAVAAAELVFTLLGEGTFHQTHCGSARLQLMPAIDTLWRGSMFAAWPFAGGCAGTCGRRRRGRCCPRHRRRCNR